MVLLTIIPCVEWFEPEIKTDPFMIDSESITRELVFMDSAVISPRNTTIKN
jgi:hypothetical protein